MIYVPTAFQSSPVHPHAHSYILPCKLQLGMQPRHWISTKGLCSRREGWVICNPAIKKRMALTLEFLHHISNVQMLPRSHVVPLRRKWQGGLVMCGRSFTTVLDGTSPLLLLLLPSSLLLISLHDQVQLNLRLHAGASRFYGPVGVLHPVTARKREVIVSKLKPHLSTCFLHCFLIWSILKFFLVLFCFYVCLDYWLLGLEFIFVTLNSKKYKILHIAVIIFLFFFFF